MHDEGLLVKQILREGVDGYLLKSIQQAELKSALKQIFQGMPYVSPEITRLMLSDMLNEQPVELLTDREREILNLIAKNIDGE